MELLSSIKISHDNFDIFAIIYAHFNCVAHKKIIFLIV